MFNLIGGLTKMGRSPKPPKLGVLTMLSWLDDDVSSERRHHTGFADVIAIAACVIAALLLLHHHASAGHQPPASAARAPHAAMLHQPVQLVQTS